MSAVPSEQAEQIRLVRLLNRTPSPHRDGKRLLFAHVPNGGRRSKQAAGEMKSAGVLAGMPDLLIFDAPDADGVEPFVGVALELKRTKGGSLSLDQRRTLANLRGAGWCVLVCKGADAAADALRALGYLVPHGA